VPLKRLILYYTLTSLGISSFGFAQEAPVVTITPGAGNEMNIVIEPQAHQEYGVAYPLTYEFSIPL
jgi:hypothetical protein